MKKFKEIKTIVENRNIDILELIEYMDKEKFFKKREKEYLELSLQGNDVINIANVLGLSIGRIKQIEDAVLTKIKRGVVLEYFLEEEKGIKRDNRFVNYSNELIEKYDIDIFDYIDYIDFRLKSSIHPKKYKVIAKFLVSGGTVKDIMILYKLSRNSAINTYRYLYNQLFERMSLLRQYLESKGLEYESIK